MTRHIELDQLEKQVEQLPKGEDRTRLSIELLSIKSDLRNIYQLEEDEIV